MILYLSSHKKSIKYSIIRETILKEADKMKVKKILSNSRGLTLVELLASLTILGIIIIGSMQFFTQAYTYTNINQKKTAAVNVARNALMFIEKESFIATRDKFEKDPTEEISIFLCNNKYKMFWKNEDEKRVRTDCEPIEINNIDYKVVIKAEEAPNSSKINYLYYIPLKATVSWSFNGKDHSTEVEGDIKSEDIR